MSEVNNIPILNIKHSETNNWIPIPAIKGTSVYVGSCTSISRMVDGKPQNGYRLTIFDEKRSIESNNYTGDAIEIWNGIDAGELSLRVDNIQHSDGSTNIELNAVRYAAQDLNDTQKTQARANIDAFQEIHGPTDGQIPRYSATSSLWYPGDLTPAEVGAVNSNFTINGKPINNPTTDSASITLDVDDIGNAVPITRTINNQTLSSDVTLTPFNIGAIHSSLKINGKTINNPTTNSASINLTAADVEAVSNIHTINDKYLIDDVKTRIIESNVTINSGAWSSDSTPSSYKNDGYSYSTTIEIIGVTDSMIPQVNFSLADSISGTFAPIAETVESGVKIYASDIPETVTIPTIICFS